MYYTDLNLFSFSYVIKSKKTYKNALTVDNLHASFINDVNVKNIIKVKEETTLSDSYFKKIIIKGNITADEGVLENINNENVKELYKKTVFIDEPQTFDTLKMETANGNQLI